MNAISFPPWAQTMREIFRGETISQFVLHGNLHDLVLHHAGENVQTLSLHEYLTRVLFDPFEVILGYDRSRGIQVLKGAEGFQKFLSVIDKFNGSQLASTPQLPRAPLQALDLIDRYLQAVVQQQSTPQPLGIGSSVAILLDYTQFLVPHADSVQLTGDLGALLIRILRWAQDPQVQGANILTCLLSENLGELHPMVGESEFNAKIAIPLPNAEDIAQYLQALYKSESGLEALSPFPIPVLSQKLLGLSRVHVKNMLMRALRNQQKLSADYLSKLRKESIEKEAGGRLVFLESPLTMDAVSGHKAAKEWLRQDASLLAQGESSALPMGYLLAGRIGTGKTFLVQCFAGECGVPFVELKNFRDKWVGSTEGNLEKVFQILRALGQVVVFVDEADQATGKRESGDGDSGLSGRIYAMLAKEMSNTRNRGKILWIFATSRPDLVEVDLKRTGRLDVHIPLFPPETEEDRRDLFIAMGRKLKLDLNPQDIPDMSQVDGSMGGNEMEALLVRARRSWLLRKSTEPQLTLAQVIREVVAEFRPSAHKARLELMDLLAVKECTDERFLPERFRHLDLAEVDRRIGELI